MGRVVAGGVPDVLAKDGWWLVEDAVTGNGKGALPPPAAPPLRADRPGRGAGLALLALVLAGDVLIYRHAPGLGLVLLALSVAGAVALTTPRRDGLRAHLWTAAILIASLLPLMEQAQVLSLGFGLLGLTVACLRLALGPDAPAMALLRFAGLFPVVGLTDGAEVLRDLSRAGPSAGWAALARRLGRGWAMPLGLGLIFTALLAGSNPVIDLWLARLGRADWNTAPLLLRLCFWAGIALVLWPFLAIAPRAAFLMRPHAAPGRALPVDRLGLNPTSIANALALFNLIFAAQTGLDLTYLWAGATLPEGLSHAEYAHRGAYPLVATALMAGAFALAARPFTQGRPVLRFLLLMFIAQNVALVISSLYRLDLYINAFGLTYLRLHAGLWMGLVAAGLALTLWQTLAGRSNGWLLARVAALGLVVLYGSSFLNFAHVIAAGNLRLAARAEASVPLDLPYLCSLPEGAAGAIRAHDLASGKRPLCSEGYVQPVPVIRDWREWGFRKARVAGYLRANPPACCRLTIEEPWRADPDRGR